MEPSDVLGLHREHGQLVHAARAAAPLALQARGMQHLQRPRRSIDVSVEPRDCVVEVGLGHAAARIGQNTAPRAAGPRGRLALSVVARGRSAVLSDESLLGLGLGMPRGEVLLTEHDPRWARCFELERAGILAALPGIGLSLEHVGSTSVPALVAKPILDVLGWCPDVADIDRRMPALERRGYVFKGERGIPGRRYLVRYDAAKQIGFIHLHLYAQSHPQVAEVLAFRDTLRAHPEVATLYAELKRSLQREHPCDLDRYVELKSAFIVAHSK